MLLAHPFRPTKIAGSQAWLKADQMDAPSRTPDEVSGLQLWLKSDAITGLINGDPIGAWNDSSAEARNFSSAGAARPTYVTNVLNGKPAVRFAGAQYLDAGDTLGFERTDSFTILYVANQTGGEAAVLAKMDRGANYIGWEVGCSAGNGNKFIPGCIGSYPSSSLLERFDAITINVAQIVTWTYGGTSEVVGSRAYKDGFEQTGTSVTNTLSTSILTTALLAVGARVNGARTNIGEYITGDVFEIAVFNRVLTLEERRSIERAWGAKYAITYAPATDADPVGFAWDSSGKGNHATQETAANKPTWKTSIVNGRPIMRFDGTTDWLQVVSTDFDFVTATEYTIFLVAKAAAAGADANGGTFLGKYAGGAGYLAYVYTTDGGFPTRGLYWQDDGNGFISSNTLVNGTFYVVTYLRDAANERIRKNGVEVATRTRALITTNAAALYIGTYQSPATQFFNGDIAEVIINKGTALALADIQRLERYLARKYGLTLG